ncbi:MAG: GntR family transcriptional regulator [Victivallaceae bacterium]|nr:GntR family transcriptional regulator [Victivallaceae bacterium]
MPVYTDIMNTLIREIETGEYPPHSMLPSEKEICVRFDVSRTSVRNALKSMQQGGYINREHGRGSFVMDKKLQIHNEIVNIGIILNHNQQHSVDAFTSNPLFGKKFQGIQKAASRHQSNSSMFIYDDSQPIDNKLFVGYKIDGFMDLSMTISPNLNDYFIEHDCKVCSIINSFHIREYNYNWPLIINDYMSGVKAAIKYYSKQGLTRFGFFAVAKDGMNNFKLYQQAMNVAGNAFDINSVVLFPENQHQWSFSQERAEYFIQKLFSSSNIPEVLFTDGYFIADEMVKLLSMSDSGKKILKKTRICVIADPAIEKLSHIGIMDFVVPANEQVGVTATETLLRQIAGEQKIKPRISVPAEFVHHETLDS